MKFAWDKNWPILGFLRITVLESVSKKILRSFAEKRMNISNIREREAKVDMIYRAYSQKCSSEVSITMMMEFGSWARMPLNLRLVDVKIPICFIYGETDEMKRDTAD